MKNLKKKKEKLFSMIFFWTLRRPTAEVVSQFVRSCIASLSLSLSEGVQGSSVLCLQGCQVHRRASSLIGPPSIALLPHHSRSGASHTPAPSISLASSLTHPSHASSALFFFRPFPGQYRRQVSFCKDSLVQR